MPLVSFSCEGDKICGVVLVGFGYQRMLGVTDSVRPVGRYQDAHVITRYIQMHQTTYNPPPLHRSVDVVKKEGQRKEVPNAENDAPEQIGSAEPEEAGREVPSTQDRALPHKAIPEVDEELRHGGVRVVPVQDADKGTPVQELRQVEDATEDNVGGGTEKDRKREEPVHDQGNVRGRAVHGSNSGFLENDEGGGEDGATRPGGGEGGGGYTVSLARFLTVSLSFLLFPFLVFRFPPFPFLLSFSPSFLPLIMGQAGRGQGESPRAAGGLFEGAADGERERTVYIIVMIQ